MSVQLFSDYVLRKPWENMMVDRQELDWLEIVSVTVLKCLKLKLKCSLYRKKKDKWSE